MIGLEEASSESTKSTKPAEAAKATKSTVAQAAKSTTKATEAEPLEDALRLKVFKSFGNLRRDDNATVGFGHSHGCQGLDDQLAASVVQLGIDMHRIFELGPFFDTANTPFDDYWVICTFVESCSNLGHVILAGGVKPQAFLLKFMDVDDEVRRFAVRFLNLPKGLDGVPQVGRGLGNRIVPMQPKAAMASSATAVASMALAASRQ